MDAMGVIDASSPDRSRNDYDEVDDNRKDDAIVTLHHYMNTPSHHKNRIQQPWRGISSTILLTLHIAVIILPTTTAAIVVMQMFHIYYKNYADINSIINTSIQIHATIIICHKVSHIQQLQPDKRRLLCTTQIRRILRMLNFDVTKAYFETGDNIGEVCFNPKKVPNVPLLNECKSDCKPFVGLP